MAVTLDFFGTGLRSLGFVHVTGLQVNSKLKQIAFPREFWGKFAHDGLTVIIVIRSNGEVWFKDGPWIEEADLEELQKQMGDNTFPYDKLEKEPFFFDATVFGSTTPGATLLKRFANPYFDFGGTCDPNPAHYYPKSPN